MWSPEEQKVIESPYWEILIEQAKNVVELYDNDVSAQSALDNKTLAYKISGEPYRYVHLVIDGVEIITLGNESNNPYGNTNKVNLHYSGMDPKILVDLVVIKYQELKHGL